MLWNLLRPRRNSKLSYRQYRQAKLTFKPGLEMLESRTLLTVNRYWTGASGIDLNWSTAGNWRDDNGQIGVPGAEDIAIFDSGPGINTTSIVDPAYGGHIDALVLNPDWGGYLALQSPLSVDGFTPSLWASGAISAGSAGLTFNVSSSLTITSQFNKDLYGTLTNNGTITHTDSGGTAPLWVHNDTRIVNNGTYDFQGNNNGIEIGSGGNTSTFSNTGRVTKSAGGDPALFRSYLHVSYFENVGGTIDVEAGRLAFGGGQVSSSGTTATVISNGVLDLTDGTTTYYSGTFTGSPLSAGTVRLLNGTLVVGDTSATFDMPYGMFEWDGGTLDGGIAGVINAGGMTITSQSNKDLYGLLTNNGAITHTDSGGTAPLWVHNDTRIVNNGTYDFQGDGNGIEIGNGDTSTFINTGIVSKSAGGNPATVRSYLHVSYFENMGGTFSVENGRLALGHSQVSSTGGNIFVNDEAGAVLDLTDGTTTVYSGTFTSGTGGGKVALLSGTLEVGASPATFNITSGTFEWDGGTIDGGAAGLVNTGSMTITGLNNKDLFGLLTNQGTVAHTDSGGTAPLWVHRDTQIVNSGTYDFQGNSNGIEIGDGKNSTFINTGTVSKSTGGDPATVRSYLHVNYLDSNNGTFAVQAGRLALGDAIVTSTGTTVIDSGPGGVLDPTDGTSTVYSGTFSGSGQVRLLNGVLAVGAMPAIFDMGLPSSVFEWDGGIINGGSFGFVNKGSLMVTGQSNKDLFGLLTNEGTIVHNNSSGGTAPLWVHETTRIVNEGTYDFQTDAPSILTADGSTSTFINTENGTVLKSGGSGSGGVTLNVSVFNNATTVEVEIGLFNLQAGGLSTGLFGVSNLATLNFNGGPQTLDNATFQTDGLVEVTGGTLRIAGDVEGALTFRLFGGTLELTPGCRLHVGNYGQTGGLLLVDVAPPVANYYSPLCGFLRVEGQAELGGAVGLNFVDGYVPQLGDGYTFLDYGNWLNSPNGFGTAFPPAPDGLRFGLSGDQTTITVEPS